jgi:ABC-type nickel/cobalt efflux system permease component RcnA
VFGLDQLIAGLGGGGGLLVALLVALLLGLRHATDPDHLTAVSTLVLTQDRHGGRRAAVLGLAWGAGHALTLLALGLPVVLAGRFLPEAVQRAAELAVGLLIMGLALRLLVRWRRGYFHAHPHSHGDLWHAHPHVHEGESQQEHPDHHEHAHPEQLGRSPLAAFGIGLVHGVGGSAGAGLLLLSAIHDRETAVAALVVFAVGTALSMAGASLVFGTALARHGLRDRLEAAVPAFGGTALVFGAWYALAALGTLPYLL